MVYIDLLMVDSDDGNKFIKPRRRPLTDLIKVLGYQRTLQASDLWKVDESLEASVLAVKLETAWTRRVAEAHAWNDKMDKCELTPSLFKRMIWNVRALSCGRKYANRRALFEKHWREHDGRKEPSLTWALNDAFGAFFWSAGAFKVRKI